MSEKKPTRRVVGVAKKAAPEVKEAKRRTSAVKVAPAPAPAPAKKGNTASPGEDKAVNVPRWALRYALTFCERHTNAHRGQGPAAIKLLTKVLEA